MKPQTETLTLMTQNIKATPAMKYKPVVEDLKTVKAVVPSVVGLQEMNWPWYWVALRKVFPKKRYGVFPQNFVAKGHAQPIIWDRSTWELVETRKRLLHGAIRGVCRARYQNAVLLRHRQTGIKHWFKNTHYLPDAFNGDKDDRGLRSIWIKANLGERKFVLELMKNGAGCTCVGDYNIPDAEPLSKELNGRGVRYLGRKGPDYIIIVDGDVSNLTVYNDSELPESKLNTDHAGRIVHYALRDDK